MTEPAPAEALRVEGLNVFYGPMQAVHDLALSVPQGRVTALLGANGAGKTTTLKSIAGFIKPRSGDIRFMGRPLNGSPEGRVRRGLALVPDDRLLFPSLSVDDHLRAGAYRLRRREWRATATWVLGHFPDLAGRRGSRAGELSGGQAQMLAIARALMSQPKLLLLDEPSQGLAPRIVAELFALIGRLAAESALTVLLVEQNATLALDLAEYGYVLANGRLELEGPTDDLRKDPSVKRLYLGG